MKKAMTCLVFLAVLGTPAVHAQSEETTQGTLRDRFQQLGEAETAYFWKSKEERKALPDPDAMAFQIKKTVSTEVLSAAIDRSIRSNDIPERLGAMALYYHGTNYPGAELPVHPEYRDLLLGFLAADDQSNAAYSDLVVGLLTRFRSREVVVAFIDASHRTREPFLREKLLRHSAMLLQMPVRIHDQMTDAEKARTLSELQAWLDRNRDRIRFKENGRPYLAGGETHDKPPTLSAEDRARIRKDPACVLKLISIMMGSGDAAAYGPDLASRCGAALLGPDGARKLQEGLKQVGAGPPTFDQQMTTASIPGSYPTIDAVQLAVAYVAAYETNPALRNLAMEIYDELGTPEIERVLKGEPREVRKKAMALVDQVTGDKDED